MQWWKIRTNERRCGRGKFKRWDSLWYTNYGERGITRSSIFVIYFFWKKALAKPEHVNLEEQPGDIRVMKLPEKEKCLNSNWYKDKLRHFTDSLITMELSHICLLFPLANWYNYLWLFVFLMILFIRAKINLYISWIQVHV